MRILTLVLAGLFSFGAIASQGGHVIGGGVGYGFNDFDGLEEDDSGGGDNFVYDIYYRYMWHDNFGIEAGYFAGDAGIGSVFTDIFTGINNIEYSGFRATLYGQYVLSERNHLYAKLGASANKLRYIQSRPFSNGELIHKSNSDQDLYTAVGWEVRFHSGFGMNIEYQYIPVQQLNAHNLNFGMNYQF